MHQFRHETPSNCHFWLSKRGILIGTVYFAFFKQENWQRNSKSIVVRDNSLWENCGNIYASLLFGQCSHVFLNFNLLSWVPYLGPPSTSMSTDTKHLISTMPLSSHYWWLDPHLHSVRSFHTKLNEVWPQHEFDEHFTTFSTKTEMIASPIPRWSRLRH